MKGIGDLMRLDLVSNTSKGMTNRARLIKSSGCLGMQFDIFSEGGMKYLGVFLYGNLRNKNNVLGPTGYFILQNGSVYQVPLRQIKSVDMRDGRMRI